MTTFTEDQGKIKLGNSFFPHPTGNEPVTRRSTGDPGEGDGRFWGSKYLIFVFFLGSVFGPCILLSLKVNLEGLQREHKEYHEDYLGLFRLICGSPAAAAAATTAATTKTRCCVNR